MGPTSFQPAGSPMTMREQLPAVVESVAVARRAVRRFTAGLEVDVVGITLAVSEAVANVVAHAYDDGEPGVIDLTGTASPEEVAIVVRDRGRGLDAPGGTPGAGFGIEIIRRLAEDVVLDDGAPGVELTMRFRRRGPWSVH
jgi:anti-sigma regulatory factor (Ser/Thr protein kinase)